MRVAASLETDCLAAQKYTDLNCSIVVRNCRSGRKHYCKGICLTDAHKLTEEHQNNCQVDQAAGIEVTQVGMGWDLKDELLIAQQAYETSEHLGRNLKCTDGLVIKGWITQATSKCETLIQIFSEMDLGPHVHA